METQNRLAEFVQTGSDAAFSEIVSRYLDLVYSTALRLVDGDTHRPEDVAQTVFINLARVARTLPKDVKLGGWLHRDTCFAASTLMRGERRRQFRERQAAEMNALQNLPETDYSAVAPILDIAINDLGEADRAAILLRFFERHDFRAIGQALGSSEDAARMRVTRALEKLEGFLKQRGITTTAASFSAVLSANAIQTAPSGLASAISSAAILAKTTIVITTTKALAMTTLQKALVAATVTVLVGVGGYEALLISRLREQNRTFRQQQTPLVAQVQQLQRERDDTANQMAALADRIEKVQGNSAELLRLRGEVGRLRQAALNQANNKSPAAVVSKMLNESSAVELARVQIRQRLNSHYAPLIQSLHLSPETTDKLFDLTTENEMKKKIMYAQLLSGDMDVATALQDRDAAKTGLDSEIMNLLGDSGYAQYDQFNHATAAGELVKGLNRELGDKALNDDQSKRVQALFAAKPDIITDEIDLFRSQESFDALFQSLVDRGHHDLQEAANFLTPDQLAAAYTIQSNYFNSLKKQFALARQSISKIRTQNK